MKIKTLGTSHGDPTKIRFNSSNVITESGNYYIIDAGVPVNSLLIRENIELGRIKSIFITHTHDDHIGGLPSLIKSLIKYPIPNQHTDIYLPEDVISPLKIWLNAMHLDNFDEYISFHVVSEGLVYEDEAIKVFAYGTKHIASENSYITYGYVFENAYKRMLYTGDLRYDFTDFPIKAFEKPIDLCVCECTHYGPEWALPTFKSLSLKRLLLNHVGNDWADKLGELDLINHYKELPYPCCVAHDGDEFEI